MRRRMRSGMRRSRKIRNEDGKGERNEHVSRGRSGSEPG